MPLCTGKITLRQWATMELAREVPWFGHLTPDDDCRRAEAWAKAMGTGYPSTVEDSGLIDQDHQNPSREAEGQEVEAAGAGDAEAGENEKHEAED